MCSTPPMCSPPNLTDNFPYLFQINKEVLKVVRAVEGDLTDCAY